MSDKSRSHAQRLIATANELLSMARDLERTANELPDALTAGEGQTVGDDPMWAELAAQAYRDRRRRTQIFGNGELFGEPAWDILLDLFVAAKDRKRVPITSACIGAAVPSTTGLRWLQILEKEGLVIRESDASDARRTFVRLSADAYARMVAYLRESSRALRQPDDSILLRGG